MCIVFGISNVCGIKKEQYGDTGGRVFSRSVWKGGGGAK